MNTCLRTLAYASKIKRNPLKPSRVCFEIEQDTQKPLRILANIEAFVQNPCKGASTIENIHKTLAYNITIQTFSLKPLRGCFKFEQNT